MVIGFVLGWDQIALFDDWYGNRVGSFHGIFRCREYQNAIVLGNEEKAVFGISSTRWHIKRDARAKFFNGVGDVVHVPIGD